jgi:hypothetical protein
VMDGEPTGRQMMSRPALMRMIQTAGVMGQRDGHRSVVVVVSRRMVAESGVTPVVVAVAVRRR